MKTAAKVFLILNAVAFMFIGINTTLDPGRPWPPWIFRPGP